MISWARVFLQSAVIHIAEIHVGFTIVVIMKAILLSLIDRCGR